MGKTTGAVKFVLVLLVVGSFFFGALFLDCIDKISLSDIFSGGNEPTETVETAVVRQVIKTTDSTDGVDWLDNILRSTIFQRTVRGAEVVSDWQAKANVYYQFPNVIVTQ